ncbi:MAG: ABC transporter substrate-binding protein [Desulfobacterales bacterium]|nr:ABC transporter substrate-binding protein [Desulfobacterales bacterium]
MTIKKFIGFGSLFTAALGFFLLGNAGTVPAMDTTPLAQIIEGAKKEGTVSVSLKSSFTPKSMVRLQNEIKNMFGVSLKVKFDPSQSFPKNYAQIIMEKKAGVPPSYDLMTFNAKFQLDGFKDGIFEKVDWRPLLTQGTVPEVMSGSPPQIKELYGLGLTYYTAHRGIIYNPEKVPADKVPKNFSDLADPMWKGKVGVANYTSGMAEFAYIRGKEKTLADLQAIMKNGAIQGRYVDLLNRYLLGEIVIQYSISGFLKDCMDKGMPAAWRSLDFSYVGLYQVVALKGARHPNAAKLLALYLASPAGAKFTLEDGGGGSRYYPGNFEHDIRVQDEKLGLRTELKEANPELMAFSESKESKQWEREIKLMFQTGGAQKSKKKK